ncbi:hypothetical protein QIT82_gp42 [Pseudomonas phage psageK9]|uniref:Uncharacterized protein n=1 Tax=Pseudomonas phage psageK9 TaxID=2875722 RepID=A0AAE9BSE3_9CAUD|nr:hypothetical protein QIT82_gp42 [Pseudomonas phage psageK9]UAW53912.1 hypothetical protein psageK9_42c [Pseudomonas phage psageK9]
MFSFLNYAHRDAKQPLNRPSGSNRSLTAQNPRRSIPATAQRE